MISQGNCSQSVMARSVLPEAVGPIKKIAGGLRFASLAAFVCAVLNGALDDNFDGNPDDTLAPSQKQLVQLCQRNERPGWAPMVTLATAFCCFHVS